MFREKPKEEFPARIRVARWLGHQRWIPKGQDRLLRMILNPDAGYDFPFEVDFFGCRYRGNTKSSLDWRVLLYGAYAPSELSVLGHVARYLRRQGRRVVYLDIGANIGLRACLFDDAKVFRVNGNYRFAHSLEAHRFEPRLCEVLIVPPEHLQMGMPICC